MGNLERTECIWSFAFDAKERPRRSHPLGDSGAPRGPLARSCPERRQRTVEVIYGIVGCDPSGPCLPESKCNPQKHRRTHHNQPRAQARDIPDESRRSSGECLTSLDPSVRRAVHWASWSHEATALKRPRPAGTPGHLPACIASLSPEPATDRQSSAPAVEDQPIPEWYRWPESASYLSWHRVHVFTASTGSKLWHSERSAPWLCNARNNSPHRTARPKTRGVARRSPDNDARTKWGRRLSAAASCVLTTCHTAGLPSVDTATACFTAGKYGFRS
jgi:hypothetical protein